jgi:hypothetical protein
MLMYVHTVDAMVAQKVMHPPVDGSAINDSLINVRWFDD